MTISYPKSFPQPQMIKTNGVELSVHCAGTPGKPIVLCHGWPELAFSWRHQIQPLVEAGYHVIVPNQRGYADSSQPSNVEDYDMPSLCEDLTGLLDHFDYDDAVFVGHDWGAIVTWGLTQLHPKRMSGLINLSVPYLHRGPEPWVDFWESQLGDDFYIVHFNRQPSVAAKIFDENVEQLLRNLYRTKQWLAPAEPAYDGMPLIGAATSSTNQGELCMSEEDLAVFVQGFKTSGFDYPICWYRNFNRNWHLLADSPETVDIPVLMLHGRYDIVPQSPTLKDVAADLEVEVLECGHWIQQELPEQTNQLMLDWLAKQG